MLLSLLYAVVAYLTVVVGVSARPITNAERLSRGLPPKAPARRWDATRTHRLLPRASGSPAVNAYMQITNSNGSLVGWLATDYGSNEYVITTTPSSAELFTVPANYNTNFTTILDGTNYVQIAAQKAKSNTFSSGSNYAYLGYGDTADDGHDAAVTYYNNSGLETSVFGFPEGVNGNITITFTDSDGEASLNVYYNPNYDVLAVGTSHSALPVGFAETNKVTLKWVATPSGTPGAGP